MRKFFLHLLMQLLIVCISGQLLAQIPSGYYTSATGKNKAELKTALHAIIMKANVLNYGSGAGSTWSGFAQTDVREDGTVWDMYSSNKVVANGNYAATGMNIEHSFPKSWWGGDERQAYKDLFNLNPSDATANSAKSNYTMAVVDGNVSFTNGVIKVGKSSSRPGGTIDAWEPSDDYKGDFARSYMYMVTCYEDYSNDWTTTSALNELDKNTYPTFQQWAYELLLKWSREDPVSEKEVNRNNTVYKIQGNRNPFIDHPELAEYIWGTKTDATWAESTDPVLYAPANNSTVDLGVTSISKSLQNEISVSGANLTGDLAISVTGTGFSVNKASLTKDEVAAGAKITVSYTSASAVTTSGTLLLSGGGVSTTVNLKAEAVDGIPALEASNITSKSFIASWKNVSDASAQYQLNLYQSDQTTLVSGYPVTVSASSEKYAISNLVPETQYYYKLTGDGLTSNMVSAKTLVAVPAITTTPQNLDFTALPNQVSSTKSISVTTEYISSNITVKIDSPFELSTDQQTWTGSLTLPSAGGTVYVHMSSSAEGSYQSTLSLSCAEISDPEELTVTGVAQPAKTFFEDFEKSVTNGYTNGNVECTTGSWTFANTLIMTNATGDLKRGAQSARMGKSNSSISMDADKQNGVGTLSFYAGTFGSDASALLDVFYSTDGGTNWISAGQGVTATNTFDLYSYKINVSGAVRIKMTKTAAATRINVDDISMTDYTSTGISQNESDTFSSYVQNSQLVIQNNKTQYVYIYNVSGQVVYKQKLNAGVTTVTLPHGMYILKGSETVRKIVIK